MKGNKFIIMVLTFFLLAGLLSPLAAGENDSLHVILTVEDRNYSAGDTITIEMRVYDKGQLTDVPPTGTIMLAMSTAYNHSNPVNISVSNKGTGIYQGVYTIKASDNYPHLYFLWSVRMGNDYEEGEATIHVYRIRDTVDVTIGGQKSVPAKPGDVVVATVLVRTGATPIPITGFSELYVENPEGVRQDLTGVEVATGIYEVTYNVPSVSVSGEYEITAHPAEMGDSDSAIIKINVLDVWYHKISTIGEAVSFEVCVADNDGAPVDGASFYIRRNGWPNDEYYGTTNATGKSLLHVTDVSGAASFSGYVLAAGLNQTIEGTVFNPVAEAPDHNDFDILWEGTEQIFKPGTNVAIPYGAYLARIPASSRPIIYYVSAMGTDFALFGDAGSHADIDREVIAAGTITPDTMGKFTLEFKTPEEQCIINVRFEVPLDKAGYVNQTYDLDDGFYYETWPENAWNTYGFEFYSYDGKLDGDKGVSIGVGSFKPGKLGELTVKLDAGVGDPIYAMWAIGESSLDDTANYDPEWFSWVPAGTMLQLRQEEDGSYKSDFMLPKFITDQDVTVAVGYVDVDGLPHFDVKTESPGSDIPWLWIGIIIIIIVVVIIIIVVAKEKMMF